MSVLCIWLDYGVNVYNSFPKPYNNTREAINVAAKSEVKPIKVCALR